MIGPNLECAVGAGRVDAVASDVIDHFAENRALVAIAEAEHRIEMHRRTALRHYAGNHPRRSVFPEQAVHDLADGLMRRALAHADQHDAFADRHDIAAFDARAGELLVGIAKPDFEVAALEAGMELVDGPLQQGFGLARRPEHRVAGHTAIDPARRIPLKERVRNRRHQKRCAAQDLQKQRRALAFRQILNGDTADQVVGQLLCRHRIEPWPDSASDNQPNAIGGNAPVEDPRACLGIV